MLHPIKNPLLLILLGGFTIVTAKSQTIEILTQVNSPKPKSDSRFEYLNHKTNIVKRIEKKVRV